MIRKIFLFIATGAGSGYFPKAPGTAGSVVGVLLYLPLSCLPPVFYLAAVIAITLIGVPAARVAETHFNTKDPKEVVIDEIAGMLLALFMVPASVVPVLAGFLLFRLLDITKPGLKEIEKIKGGWGIMLDDIAAGVIANLLLHGGMVVLS